MVTNIFLLVPRYFPKTSFSRSLKMELCCKELSQQHRQNFIKLVIDKYTGNLQAHAPVTATFKKKNHKHWPELSNGE